MCFFRPPPDAAEISAAGAILNVRPEAASATFLWIAGGKKDISLWVGSGVLSLTASL
jgi:hypothetical protein